MPAPGAAAVAIVAAKAHLASADFDSIKSYFAFGSLVVQNSAESIELVDHGVLEMAAFKSLTSADFSVASVNEKFDPAYLWAHPSF